MYDCRFVLSERKIIDTLIHRLYGRKDVFIRELLKNSIDACRIRRELLKKRGVILQPQIVFELTDDGWLIVSDNGIGMDESDVKKYFTRIGESFYKSKEFKEERLEFEPLSQFGIGVLTYFLAADKIVIETKKKGKEPLYIEIYGADEYLFVREGEREDVGTTVKLHLKDDVKGIALKRAIREYARHVEIPIKLRWGGKETVIQDEGYKVPHVRRHARKRIYVHKLNIQKKDMCGEIAIFFGKDSKFGLVPISYIRFDSKPLSYRKFDPESIGISSSRNFALSFNGIFISFFALGRGAGIALSTPLIWPFRATDKVYGDLDIKKRIVDIDVSGVVIQRNSKYAAFERRIAKYLISELKKLLKERRLSKIASSLIVEDFLRYSFYRKSILKDVLDLILEDYYFAVFSKIEFCF